MKPLWKDLAPPARPAADAQWLITFADLVSLLVVFFVLLFSMKEIDRDRWEQLTGSFQGVFAPREAVVWQRPDGFNNAAKKIHGNDDQLTYLAGLLKRRLGADEVWAPLVVTPKIEGGEALLALPLAWVDGQPDAVAVGTEAMARLAKEVRNWDNPVTLRLVRAGKPAQALEHLTALYQAALGQGAGEVMSQWEWRTAGDTPEGLWLVINRGASR